jgi:hypothetical protein
VLDTRCRQGPGASQVIVVMRVAAIDDDVAGLQQRRQLFEQGIDCRRGHHQPDCARHLQRIDELPQGRSARCAHRDEAGDALGGLVMHHAIMIAAQQAGHHAGPHAPQSDHADLHLHAPRRWSREITESSPRSPTTSRARLGRHQISRSSVEPAFQYGGRP